MSVFKPRKKFDRWGADSFTVDELVRLVRRAGHEYVIPRFYADEIRDMAERKPTFLDVFETSRRIEALRKSCGVEPRQGGDTITIRKPVKYVR